MDLVKKFESCHNFAGQVQVVLANSIQPSRNKSDIGYQ